MRFRSRMMGYHLKGRVTAFKAREYSGVAVGMYVDGSRLESFSCARCPTIELRSERRDSCKNEISTNIPSNYRLSATQPVPPVSILSILYSPFLSSSWLDCRFIIKSHVPHLILLLTQLIPFKSHPPPSTLT